MKIARRTGAGRGVYELAGRVNGLGPDDLRDCGLIVVLPFGIELETHLRLTDQGGKWRLVMGGAEIQVQRQIAALLLMPKPIRADEAMASDPPILRTNKYAIESLDVRRLYPPNNDTVKMELSYCEIINQTAKDRFDVDDRFRRVAALWSQSERFASEVSSLLKRHRDLVMSHQSSSAELESVVAELQQSLPALPSASVAHPAIESDPLPALDRVEIDLAEPLASKPFLILTGPSGTGKSRGAVRLATAFDYGGALSADLAASKHNPATCMAFVPVEANWIDQRDLLGYRHSFGPARTVNGVSTNETFALTETLRLILRAWHPLVQHMPHFLVLDEMNLSHVERYFSSFLSLLEADRIASPGAVELVSASDLNLILQILKLDGGAPMEVASAEIFVAEARGLPFPRNLHIVGTVNVDETTYMFSPKVLDRAFVMELGAPVPSSYIKAALPPARTVEGIIVQDLLGGGGSALPDSSADRIPQLLAEAAAAANLAQVEVEHMVSDLAAVLDGIYSLLDPVGFAPGFRACGEASRFVAVALRARRLISDAPIVPADWHEYLDKAVLMKMLPKVHGNRRQLGDCLSALSLFFKAEPIALSDMGAVPPVTAPKSLDFKLPLSAAKIDRMMVTLQGTGYTTFIN